jgi:hypothetical protein
VTVTDQRELARLRRNLTHYAAYQSRITQSEIIFKIGNDVRINVFGVAKNKTPGFWGYRFKGKDIAFRELARRTRAGKGTFVRTRDLNAIKRKPIEVDKNGKPLTNWQKGVWNETMRRQKGTGVLAVGFLTQRYRYRKGDDGKIVKFLDRNISRTLGTLVEIEKTENAYTLRGLTPGLDVVSERYKIADKAIDYVNRDKEIYLKRKFDEALAKMSARK